MLRYLVTCSVLIGLWCLMYPLEAVELGADVQAEQVKYQAELEKIDADSKAAIQAEKDTLIKALEKELKNASRKGDLDLAKQLQSRIDELQKQVGGKDLFGVEVKPAVADKATVESIKVLRAFLRIRETREMIDVTVAVQGLVNAGTTKITPQTHLSDKVKEQLGIDFMAEIETSAGRKMCRGPWNQGFDLNTGETF